MKDLMDGIKPLTVSLTTACALIGCGHSKLWELINNGTIQTIAIGRKRFAIYASLEELVSPHAIVLGKVNGGDKHVQRARKARAVRRELDGK